MPAAKYREFALAANGQHQHGNCEKANIYVKEGYRYYSANNGTAGCDQVFFASDEYRHTQNAPYQSKKIRYDVSHDYVNVGPFGANLSAPAGRPGQFKDGGELYYPAKTELRENVNDGGNFYLALDGQPGWRDSPPAYNNGTKADGYSRMDTYENYPFCTTFSGARTSQNYTNTRDCVPLAQFGPDFVPVNTKPESYPYMCHNEKGRTSSEHICTEQLKLSVSSLNELEYAIEHCKEVEARALDTQQPDCHSSTQNLGETTTSNAFYSLKPWSPQGDSTFLADADNQHLNPEIKNLQHQSEIHSNGQNAVKDIPKNEQRSANKVKVVTAINGQIRRLREEMLELRAATMTFKEQMEKMFSDLAALNGVMRLEESKIQQQLPGASENQIVSSQPCELEESPRETDEFPDRRSPETPNQHHDMEMSSLSPTPTNQVSDLFVFTNPPDNNTQQSNNRSSHEVHLERLIDGGEKTVTTKRGKSNERPNSDSFASTLAAQKPLDNQLSTMSLPHSPSGGVSAKRLAGRNSRHVNKSTGENLRILPVLSHSNAALHTSECSIDSGYQGSSITAPRERGRDLTSQVVTPASPISESPVVEEMFSVDSKGPPADAQEAPVGQVCPKARISSNSDECAEVFCEGVTSEATSFLTSAHLESFVQPKRPKPKSRGDLSSSDNLDVSGKEAPEIAEPVRPKPRASHSSRPSTSSEVGEEVLKVVRPVPKPRTAVSKDSEKGLHHCIEGSSAGEGNQLCDDSRSYCTESLTGSEVQVESGAMRISNSLTQVYAVDYVKNTSQTDGQQVPKQSPLQCLTVIKQSPTAPSGPAGATSAQKRIKLGVSAISTQHREQAKVTVDEVRLRKANNTKQALKEKFAAVLEHSNAKNKANGACAVDDSELSVVRRRSMRMMTEFQIYDFKDSSASLTNLLNDPLDVGKLSEPGCISCSTSNLSAIASSASKAFSVSTTSIPKQTVQKVETTNRDQPNPARQSQQDKNQSAVPLSRSLQAKRGAHVIYTSCHASLPLPPPPPPPPRSPSVVEKPPSVGGSEVSTYSELELMPQSSKRPTALLPSHLIRPKPVPIGTSCDIAAQQANGVAAVKLSPSAGSAFTPVLSSSLRSLQDKPSPIADRYDVPYCPDTEFKRRVSLPMSSVSNRAKVLAEILVPNHQTSVPGEAQRPSDGAIYENVPGLQRRTSLRKQRKSDQLGSVISAEEAHVTSYSVYSQPSTDIPQQPKENSNSYDRVEERRRPAYPERTRSSSANRSNKHDLENQPVRYNRTDNIKHVVSALRTGGYLVAETPPTQNGHQVSCSTTSSLTSCKGGGTSSQHQAHSFVRNTKPRSSTGSRVNKKSENHDYETVRSADHITNLKTDISSAAGRHRSVSRETVVRPQESAAPLPSPSKGHKSTVAFLRASFMVKREKPPRSATTDGKRESASTKIQNERSRSISAGGKSKKQDSQIANQKPSTKSKTSAESKPKEAISSGKKSKHDTKQPKEGKSTKKNNKSGGKESQKNSKDSSAPLPRGDPIRHGNADSEVMERFLAAAAASHTTRSPLQKLRSSFRAPRNKTKFLQAAQTNRVKDDMDMNRIGDAKIAVAKKVPLRQDHYTYV